MIMINIPFSENYGQNVNKYNAYSEGYELCAVCGRGIREEKVKYRVHVWRGSKLLLEEELSAMSPEDKDGSYMGEYALGRDCLKRHPELKPYLCK